MSGWKFTAVVLSLAVAGAVGWRLLSRCPEPIGLPGEAISAMIVYSSGGHVTDNKSALREVLENYDHLEWRENYLKWFTSLDSSERLVICGIALASQTESFWDFEFYDFSHIYSDEEAADRMREIELARRNIEWFRWHLDRKKMLRPPEKLAHD